MKTKTKLTAALAVVLMMALFMSSTVAWFTDSENVTNKATVGGLDVELTEEVKDPDAVEEKTENPNFDDTKDPSPTNPEYLVPDPEDPSRDNPLVPGTPTDDGAEYTQATPGTSFIKAPTVKNVEQPALVRLVVTRSWDKDGLSVDKIILNKVNATDWKFVAGTDGVDYFYYTKILETGAETSVPFDYFSISASVDNSYIGAAANIDVKVEAVQAAGMNVTSAADVPEDVWSSVVPVTPAEEPTPAE